VFGRPNRGDRYAGVQWKGEATHFGGTVTPDELRREVEKAKAFEPPLQSLTLVTTARTDEKRTDASAAGRSGLARCRWAGRTPTSWQRCDIGYAHDQLGGELDLSERFLEQTLGNSPPLQRFG
jgi:hypothetical protein